MIVNGKVEPSFVTVRRDTDEFPSPMESRACSLGIRVRYLYLSDCSNREMIMRPSTAHLQTRPPHLSLLTETPLECGQGAYGAPMQLFCAEPPTGSPVLGISRFATS